MTDTKLHICTDKLQKYDPTQCRYVCSECGRPALPWFTDMSIANAGLYIKSRGNGTLAELKLASNPSFQLKKELNG